MCYISHFAHFKSSSVQQTAKALFSYLFEIHVFLFSPHSHNQLLPAQKYLSINKCSGHKLICNQLGITSFKRVHIHGHQKYLINPFFLDTIFASKPFRVICLRKNTTVQNVAISTNIAQTRSMQLLLQTLMLLHKHVPILTPFSGHTSVHARNGDHYTVRWFFHIPYQRRNHHLCGHPTSEIARPTLSPLLSFKILGS